MFLYDYHPWCEGKNVNIDKITNTLINLKKTAENSWNSPVNFFTKVLTNPYRGLSRLVSKSDKSNVFCVVPSHAKNMVSPGLLQLARNVSHEFNFKNKENLLSRTTTVDKAASGGQRSIQIHLDSVVVVGQENVKGKTVYLFDDITTTGCSLLACKQLLLEAGAERVAMIALGRTFSEY